MPQQPVSEGQRVVAISEKSYPSRYQNVAEGKLKSNIEKLSTSQIKRDTITPKVV